MFKDDELHETRYCENCLELQKKFQAKEQLSVKQSHELIRLRKERQENKKKILTYCKRMKNWKNN